MIILFSGNHCGEGGIWMPLFSSLWETGLHNYNRIVSVATEFEKKVAANTFYKRCNLSVFLRKYLQGWASKERLFNSRVLPRRGKKSAPNQSPWAGPWISRERNHGQVSLCYLWPEVQDPWKGWGLGSQFCIFPPWICLSCIYPGALSHDGECIKTNRALCFLPCLLVSVCAFF